VLELQDEAFSTTNQIECAFSTHNQLDHGTTAVGNSTQSRMNADSDQVEPDASTMVLELQSCKTISHLNV
jgi:hypothetical protein